MFLEELESAIKRACDDAGPDVKAGLAAAIEVCEEAKNRLLETIREANRRHGIDLADRLLVRDLPAELQTLNQQYRQIEWRIREIREVASRVVVRPDGETIVLPRGHVFGGFTEDGKVLSGTSSVEIHTPTEQPDRWKAAAAASATRAVRVRCHARQRRGSSGRPRAQATRSTARSGDSGDDGPLDEHSRRGELRHVAHVLNAFLRKIGGTR